MMTLIAGCIFLVCVFISIAEVWYERDWPRETYRFVLYFGAITALAFFLTL
jgi:Ca2+/Na+ antiporter